LPLWQKKQTQTSACKRTSGQITALGYFQFYILPQQSGLAYRLLRPLTVTEKSEKGYSDIEKLIIELENIFFGIRM
jgi:hypothetical protein